MEDKKPYVRPELEELGQVHDVTGGSIFDVPDILGGLLGGGKGKPKPPGRTGSF